MSTAVKPLSEREERALERSMPAAAMGDRSRLEHAAPGERFPGPIGTLGEADRTLENLDAMCFPRRMTRKALRHTGGEEHDSVDYIMANVRQPAHFWSEPPPVLPRWQRNTLPSAASVDMLQQLMTNRIVTRQDRVHVLHAYTKRLSMTARREHERNRTPAIAKPVTDHTAASFQEIMQATDDEIEELHKSIEILGRPTRRVAQYERLRRRRRAAGVGGPDVPLVLRNGQFILATEATPAPTGPVALPELAPPAAATGVSWGSAIVAPSTHDDNGIDLSVTDHGRQTTRQKATGLLINGLRSGELEDVLAQTDAGTDEDPPSWLKPVQPETETEPELETEPEPELSATRGSDAGSSTGAAQQAGSERAEEGDTAKPQAEAEKAQEDVATWVVGWIKAQLFQNPISKIASDQPPQTHSAASRAIQEDNSVPPPGPLQPVSEVEATQLAPQVQPSTAASTTGHLVVSTASEGAANSPAIVPPSRSGSAESQAQAQAPSPAPTPVTRAAKSLSEQLEDLLAGQTSRAKNAESQEDRAVREATAQVAAAEQAQADTAELARIESVRVEAETWVDIMRAKRAAKKLQKKKEDKSKEELEAAEAETAVRRAAAAERQHAHAALARQRDDLRSSRE